MDWFNLRQYLALLDLVILFDKETNDVSRNHFGSDVDDVCASTKASSVMDWEKRYVEPVNAEVGRRDGRH